MITKDRILAAALYMSKRDSWSGLTRDAVAREAGCAAGSVNQYYGTVASLKAEVMRIAVEKRIPSIVLEGLAARHPEAMRADHDLRAEVLLSL